MKPFWKEVYEAFLERRMKGLPRHLMPMVHGNFFKPQYQEFEDRNLWSLSNAFTSAFKELNPLKQFEVTARLGTYLTIVEQELEDDFRETVAEVSGKPIDQVQAKAGIGETHTNANGHQIIPRVETFRQPGGSPHKPDDLPWDDDSIQTDSETEEYQNIGHFEGGEIEDEQLEEYMQKAA